MSSGRSVVRNLRLQQQTLDIHWKLLVWTANKRIVLLLFFVPFCLLVFICLFCEAEPKRITTTTLQKASPKTFDNSFWTFFFWIPDWQFCPKWRFFFPENPNFEGNLRIIQLQPEKFASFFSSHFLRTFFWVPGHQVAKSLCRHKVQGPRHPAPQPQTLFLVPLSLFPENSIVSNIHTKMKFFLVLLGLFSVASLALSQPPSYDMIFAEDYGVPVTAKTDTGVFLVLKTFDYLTSEVCCFYRNDVKTPTSYVALRKTKVLEYNITDNVPLLCAMNDGRCGMTISGKVDPTCPTPVETFLQPPCYEGSSILGYNIYPNIERTYCGVDYKTATTDTGYTLVVACVNTQ